MRHFLAYAEWCSNKCCSCHREIIYTMNPATFLEAHYMLNASSLAFNLSAVVAMTHYHGRLCSPSSSARRVPQLVHPPQTMGFMASTVWTTSEVTQWRRCTLLFDGTMLLPSRRSWCYTLLTSFRHFTLRLYVHSGLQSLLSASIQFMRPTLQNVRDDFRLTIFGWAVAALKIG